MLIDAEKFPSEMLRVWLSHVDMKPAAALH